ncbi:hypothetical protein OFP68_14025 [Brachyspira hyodysenteriae]|uniref:hypothetical protein n=1 Tax=Brachyspira hyodysenteriae TaxID=159 RepID=UPI0022CD4DD9|nr:hypothetical protein [Brachyspira hyodysenteriae]MCZ9879990.1 hypothetical protein [Brachyspira hyodysenteriae]
MGNNVNDILSGYRVFSNKFVRTFPCSSKGFEIEAELTTLAMQMRLQIGDVEAEYKSRPEGSFSKLNTFRDGFRNIGAYDLSSYDRKAYHFFNWIIALLSLHHASFYYGIPTHYSDFTIKYWYCCSCCISSC